VRTETKKIIKKAIEGELLSSQEEVKKLQRDTPSKTAADTFSSSRSWSLILIGIVMRGEAPMLMGVVFIVAVL
jgi:Zn-dependent membrane protease YugP